MKRIEQLIQDGLISTVTFGKSALNRIDPASAYFCNIDGPWQDDRLIARGATLQIAFDLALAKHPKVARLPVPTVQAAPAVTTRLPGLPITRLPGLPITRLPGLPITRLPGLPT